MKRNLLFLLALMALPFSLFAQSEEDDMYFVPSKKTKTETRVSTVPTAPRVQRTVTRVTAVKTDTLPDYHTGQLRDVDDYNRRSTGRITEIHVGNDTLYVDADSSYVEGYSYEEQPYYEDNFYDNDYYYSSRMMRFHNYFPYDPWYWDFAYGWYDPWYDPWYGFYGRFYPYGWYSWSSWGWGWRHYPGWDLAWGHGGLRRPYRADGGPIFNGGHRSGGRGNTGGYASRGGTRGGRTYASEITRSGARASVRNSGTRSSGSFPQFRFTHHSRHSWSSYRHTFLS